MLAAHPGLVPVSTLVQTAPAAVVTKVPPGLTATMFGEPAGHVDAGAVTQVEFWLDELVAAPLLDVADRKTDEAMQTSAVTRRGCQTWIGQRIDSLRRSL